MPAVNLETAKGLLHAELPELSGETESYVEGILETSGDDFESDGDLFDTLLPVLRDYMPVEVGDGGDNDEPLRDLCMRLFYLLRGDSISTGQQSHAMERLKFDGPVSLHSMLPETRTFVQDQNENSSSALWQKKDANRKTQVDQRKLGKAEAKIKAKQTDRVNMPPGAGNEAESSLSSQTVVIKEVSSSQSVSKRQPENSLDIVIDNFDMSFQDRKLLENAALQLIYGRRYGVVGRNGVGKSTLLRLLACRELSVPKAMTILFVEQEVKAEEITAVESVLKSDVAREELLQMERQLKLLIQQEESTPQTELQQAASTTSQKLVKVYDQLQAMEADKAPARAAGILAGLGFTPTMQGQATKTFSGGWRMRLALARALFAKPDLLLLDEPTNYLDLRTIMWLEDYLQTWKSTILLVSHDRNFLRTVTTDILHFARKALTQYRGDFDTFMRVKDERLQQQQRQYEAQQREIEHVQAFIDRFRYNAKRAALVQSKIKLLERMPKVEAVLDDAVIKFKFPQVEKSSSCAFKFEDVTFQYVNNAAAVASSGASQQLADGVLHQGQSSGRRIFDRVSISANADSRIVIVGENGSGKSTLLKLILGKLEVTKGFLTTDRRLRIGYFAQHHVDMLDLSKTPLQFIESQNPGQREADYRACLGSFSVQSELQTQPLGTLSGGEKTRVALALMAYKRPNLLVFDEVSNHLDVETVEALADALTVFPGGVLLVSHDEYLIELVCKELWLCADGKITPISGGFEEYKKVVRKELEQLKVN